MARDLGTQFLLLLRRPGSEAFARLESELAVGNEQHGLSVDWLQGADVGVKLPMYGQINSLNVAVAAAILLYEVVRQRSC